MAKSRTNRTPPRRSPATPPPVPRKAIVKRFAVGLPGARLVAYASGELVFSNAHNSAFVDARTWPPTSAVIHHGQHVRFAARSDAGQWLAYTSQDPGKATWTLRWFDAITAAQPTKEERDPMPARDLTPFYVDLDPETRGAESANKARLEGLDFCGPFAVIVPRHVGLGDYRRPYVLRGGAWVEHFSVPPLAKPLADVTTTHPTRSTRLLTGPPVLVWNGQVFVPLGGEFTEMFSDRISLGDAHSTPVPAVGGGLFAMQGTRLVEARIDTVQEHLPGVSVRAVHRGPDGTMVVEAERGRLLFDPIKNEIAKLEKLLDDNEEIAGTLGSDLIVFDSGASELRRITRRELAKVARQPADIAPEVPAPPVVAFDPLGAASRPRIAAAGDLIVCGTEDTVRSWNLDLPLAKLALPQIAVALGGDRAAVLDARGMLHEIDPRTGAILGSRPTTDQPRSLIGTPDGRWIVIGKDAVSVIGARATERIEVAGAIAAAVDPDGAIAILAEGRRLALWERGQLFDIPESIEQLVAIAPLGGRRFACAGERNLFVLDLAVRELEALYEQNATPFLAASPNGRLLAWATTSSVTVGEITGATLAVVESAHYPDTYTEPDGEPLHVCGLAFLDDDRVGIALSGGHGGNVLDVVHKKTKKLDPHPGDRRSRFLFTFAGTVLIAEDPLPVAEPGPEDVRY